MMDDEEYSGPPLDALPYYDSDIFTWDTSLKLNQVADDAIVGTPTFVSNPPGLIFANIVVSGALVNVSITDTLGVTDRYKITMNFLTVAGRDLHRSKWLDVVCP